MVGLEGSGQCRAAQLYYHDFLQDRDAVPKSVADHIIGCAHCTAQVQRLEHVLNRVPAAGNVHRLNHSRELIGDLQAHFAYLGGQVTCRQVRRFLPGLLADRVRIPTPVTVHVDQCERCAEDLEHLRVLRLTQGQLATLEELYAEPPQVDLLLCRQVKLMLAETDDLRLEDVPAHVADHICSCPQCRERVYEARQELLYRCRELPEDVSYVSCGRVMSADIFGFVVPHGVDASAPTFAVDDWRRAVAAHVFSCPRCLTKVQSMHQIIYGIAERADSGVTTVYTPAGASSRKSRTSYAAYPIDVHVIGGRLKTPHRRSRTGRRLAALKRRLGGRLKLKSLVPATALVIVVSLLMGLYVVSSQSALGLNLRQINRMIAKVPNIHISCFAAGIATPRYEVWVSRPAGILAREIQGRRTVYYTRQPRQVVATPGESSPRETYITAQDLARATESIQSYLEFRLDGSRVNPELQRLTTPTDDDNAGLDAYEVIWRAAIQGGESEERRQVFYLDPIANVLRKAELYSRQTTDQEWTPRTTIYFEYPSAAEVLGHFEGLSAPTHLP